VLVVLAGFGYDLLRIGPDARQAAAGLIPSWTGQGAVLMVVSDRDRALVLRYERWDVIIAPGLAGLVNLAMLIVAAAVFRAGGPGPAVPGRRSRAGVGKPDAGPGLQPGHSQFRDPVRPHPAGPHHAQQGIMGPFAAGP
jgi:hypothetical protein